MEDEGSTLTFTYWILPFSSLSGVTRSGERLFHLHLTSLTQHQPVKNYTLSSERFLQLLQQGKYPFNSSRIYPVHSLVPLKLGDTLLWVFELGTEGREHLQGWAAPKFRVKIPGMNFWEMQINTAEPLSLDPGHLPGKGEENREINMMWDGVIGKKHINVLLTLGQKYWGKLSNSFGMYQSWSEGVTKSYKRWKIKGAQTAQVGPVYASQSLLLLTENPKALVWFMDKEEFLLSWPGLLDMPRRCYLSTRAALLSHTITTEIKSQRDLSMPSVEKGLLRECWGIVLHRVGIVESFGLGKTAKAESNLILTLSPAQCHLQGKHRNKPSMGLRDRNVVLCWQMQNDNSVAGARVLWWTHTALQTLEPRILLSSSKIWELISMDVSQEIISLCPVVPDLHSSTAPAPLLSEGHFSSWQWLPATAPLCSEITFSDYLLQEFRFLPSRDMMNDF